MLFNSMNHKVAPSDADGDPAVLSQKLQSLRQWLDENPHINGRNDSESLYFFLRSCKYDVERTKKKIKCFYLMRADRTEWYEGRDPMLPEMQELLDIGVFLPLDGVDELNRKVVIIRTSAHDPKKHTQNNVFKVSKMILDLLISLEPENCVNGIVAIFDMSGVQLGHALQLNPKLIRRSVESWQAYPCQPKILEFINTPMHVNLVLNTFRVFMTPKMRSRVVIQKRSCSVAKEMRPRDIGGLGTSYTELALKWKQLVEANADFFVEDDKYKSHLDV